MTREVALGNQILVIDRDGRIHVADVSDIHALSITEESKQAAIDAHFQKHGLTRASVHIAESHGFNGRPKRTSIIPTRISLPRSHR